MNTFEKETGIFNGPDIDENNKEYPYKILVYPNETFQKD